MKGGGDRGPGERRLERGDRPPARIDPGDARILDRVVFDEASQIFTEDAIGATRGNQLVVAGDEKQLPPTSFFQASQVDDSDGDEEEDDSTEQPDYESVLAACSTVLPQKMLGADRLLERAFL